MKLYLVRHGEAQSSEMASDPPLSPQGIKETEAVAKLLKHIQIDEILHSSKLRAKQTAEILAKTIAPELSLFQKEGLKPNDPVDPIVNEIKRFDSDVLIVSHLPFLEKLLAALLKQPEGTTGVHLTGSCVICLEGEGRAWQIIWIVSPLLLEGT